MRRQGDSRKRVVASALAAVTFDASTGTGFVGKGDVQLAFGWNNKQLQANAAGVTFPGDRVSSGDTVPVVGEACSGGGPEDGEWTSVELVESTGGGLSAVHNGVSEP